jgi:nitrite reductase/ring-hydroxylating ferredoxin subunit
MDADRRIVARSEVPSDGSLIFRIRPKDGDDPEEAILVALDDGVAGWLNACQHFRHIPLDKGSGVEMRDDEIICANHGAYFEVDTGYCTFGPCKGAYLETVEVSVEDGSVYLTDDDYELLGTGQIEDDDLTSESNVKF